MALLAGLIGLFCALNSATLGFAAFAIKDASILVAAGGGFAGFCYGFFVVYGGCTAPGAVYTSRARKAGRPPPSTGVQLLLLAPVLAAPLISLWSTGPLFRWLAGRLIG